VREDSGIFEGAQVSASYDPLLAKLAVWGEDRAQALARMRRALADYAIGGICTNLAFLSRVIAHPEFAAGNYDIGFVAEKLPELLAPPVLDGEARWLVAAAAAVAAEVNAVAERALQGAHANGLSPWVSAQRSALKW
jgi:acetyl/propionyl-CoA carboxylase alpha subunit